MKKSELAAIKARVNAATPGPWFIPYGSFEVWYRESGEDFMLLERVGNPDDAAFIAHAREDIPALLAEVERLRVIHEGDTAHLALSNQTTYSLNAQVAEAKAREVTLRVEIDRLRTIIRQVASGRVTLVADKAVTPDGTEYPIVQPTGLPADTVKPSRQEPREDWWPDLGPMPTFVCPCCTVTYETWQSVKCADCGREVCTNCYHYPDGPLDDVDMRTPGGQCRACTGGCDHQ